MICPVCGSAVPDGLDVCPACHANLAATRVMPRLTGTWCPSCGALVPSGSDTCPKCGMPVGAPSRAPERRAARERRMEERLLERERTASLPRIESAIPSEPDPSVEGVYGRERLPHTKVFLVAALASVLVVGGAALVITHPWNPDLNDARASTPADTSQAGFPGTVSKLSGQDGVSDTVPASVASADETTFAALSDAYGRLEGLSSRADDLEALLDEKGTSGTAQERAEGAKQAQQLSYDVSNLVTEISNIDVQTTGTYVDQREHVATLASWLRNRIEAINESWQLSAESDDPEADASKILRPMRGNRASDGDQAYVNLFSKNYEAWKPQER